MKKRIALFLCLILSLSILAAPAGAVYVNAANTSNNAVVAPRTTMFRDYSVSLPYSNRDDVPNQIFKTVNFVVGNQSIPFSGTLYLTKIVKNGNGWLATFEGTLSGYSD